MWSKSNMEKKILQMLEACLENQKKILENQARIEKRIEEALKESKKNTVRTNAGKEAIEKRVTEFIHDIGVPEHLKGYQYIKEAVMMNLESKEFLSVTKEVYPKIANKFNATPHKIERGIRNAIEVVFLRGNKELLYKTFGTNKRITNAPFIARLTEVTKSLMKR